MRLKLFGIFVVMIFASSLYFQCDVYARGGGGGSHGSSSSGSRSSSSSKSSSSSSSSSKGYGNTGSQSKQSGSSDSASGGYGNSAARSSAAGQKGSEKSGYGNSAVSSQGADKSSVARTPLQEKMNKSFSKQESAKALADYKAQQSKFKAGAGPASYKAGTTEQATINSVRSQVSYSSSSDYYARRTVFYDNYRWSAPTYVYSSYSSFGIWDAMMLWFMLDHIQDRQYAAMYYNHRDDAGMQQFRKELDRLSAENAELKEKVNKLDESAKAFEQQGVKPDPTYVPGDAAGIALAANIAEKEIPKKSGGFPWMMVIGVGAMALVVFMLMRRRR